MSPPIYTPDGSEVAEIVLPDGSTASQVIGPDGNVVFEAGPDIPDVELFERTDPLGDYSGSTGSFTINTANPIEGAKSLDIDSFTNIAGIGLQSVVADTLPEQGDVFSWVVDTDSTDIRFETQFGRQDGNNHYAGIISVSNGEIGIRKVISGSNSRIANTNVSLSVGAYECEITWKSDDTIELRAYNYDLANNERGSQVGTTISATDSSFATENGIGFAASGSGDPSTSRTIYDLYRVLEKNAV